ncbi:MAG: hypothetical protein ABI772_15215 [Bacteroidota bacterium]
MWKIVITRSLFISVILMLIICSCKSRKGQSDVASGTETVSLSDSAILAQKQHDILSKPNHRLVVSFISIGAGTYPKGGEMISSYIEDRQNKYKVKLAYVSKAWGREGEWDMIFSLEELNQQQQVDFINGLKELFGGNQLILILENQPARTYR